MKKVLLFMLTTVMAFSLAACESSGDSPSLPSQNSEPASGFAEESQAASESPERAESSEDTIRSLVVYFSWSGNTEAVAQEIQSQTGADLFEIVPQTPYTDNYNEMLDIASEEQNSNARPALTGGVENFEDYDVVYVGYPNWWNDMPMILYTFFGAYDFSGKTIAPFCTSGGSGLANTVASIQEMEPEATVTEGLHINGSNASEPTEDIAEWLNGIGLAQ